jgi:D-alanine-D-alanine ligase
MGDDGLSQLAQHYTEAQVDAILTSFRSIPITVMPFFSEKELLSYFANDFDRQKISKFPLVYTTAEGGAGAGRRALIPTVSKLYGVPCCNSGAYGSSIGRHKYHSNMLARMNGVSVPDSWYFMRDASWFGGAAPRRGTKVILKPTYESASIGITDSSVVLVASDFDDICRRLLTQWQQPVSVQEFRSGYEIGIPVVQLPEERALPLVGFSGPSAQRYGGEFRTFAQENLLPSREYFVPDFISEEQAAAMSAEAIKAFKACEMEGAGRIDMRFDEDGKWYAFDINESPPPVMNSGMGYAIHSLGFDYREFLLFLIGLNLRLRYPALSY